MLGADFTLEADGIADGATCGTTTVLSEAALLQMTLSGLVFGTAAGAIATSCGDTLDTMGAEALTLGTAGLLQMTLSKFVLFATAGTTPALTLGDMDAVHTTLELLRSPAPLVPSTVGARAA